MSNALPISGNFVAVEVGLATAHFFLQDLPGLSPRGQSYALVEELIRPEDAQIEDLRKSEDTRKSEALDVGESEDLGVGKNDGGGVRLSFILPAGSYATVLIAELFPSGDGVG